jgi:ParB-like nuclease domain
MLLKMPKKYSDNKTYSKNYLKRIKYIPCEYFSVPSFLIYGDKEIKLSWFFKSKVEIEKIKLPEDPLENRDLIDKGRIENIVENFHPFGWGPIRVNPNMEVLDGYHRVVSAQKLGLKYLDIIIDYETQNLLQTK